MHSRTHIGFPGELNVDLNEITTNLVPFPRLHYLVRKCQDVWVCLCVYVCVCVCARARVCV